MIKVSIIVPAFNAERYLDRCVSSVLGQTYPCFELILVDDGSTDGTNALCDKWAERDSRVRVIHQKNAGASAARNRGLDVAKGDWVGFVDVDDWVDSQMLEKVVSVEALSNVDMIMFDPYVHTEDKKQTSVDSMWFLPESIVLRKENISSEWLRFMAGTIWRCLYRRSVLDENGIRFVTTLPLSEDRLFNITAMGCSKLIYYLREPVYHYWIHSNSATGKYRADMLNVVLDTQYQIKHVLLQYWDESYIPVYERVNLVDGALLCIYNAFSPKNKSGFWKKYQQVREVVHHENICGAYSVIKKLTLRQWLVKHKCTLALCLVGVAWNIKNK